VAAEDDDDPTVRLRRPVRRRGRKWIGIALLVALLGGVAVAGVIVWQPRQAPPKLPPAAAEFDFETASEAAIAGNARPGLGLFRFTSNPRVLVLDFPDLHAQADMFNRVAAFAEKAGLPHDRLLDDRALDAAIRDAGDQPDTYYYGHDYGAGTLARFFTLAARDGIGLTPGEQKLSRLLTQEGMLSGAPGAVISIPRAGVADGIDAAARATILHHELSHGEYFTNPVYAGYAQAFWRNSMSAAERAAFIGFLTREGYDPGIEDLMINETQAYLMHTPDVRFFNAAAVGLPPAELDRLRAVFLLGMPAGWLRDCTPAPGKAPAAAVPASALAPVRSPRQRGAVSTAMACVASRTPRARSVRKAVSRSRR
jgi:hypothetical protein